MSRDNATTSLNGLMSFKTLGSLAHTTAKAGIIGMTRQLAMEGREYGIRKTLDFKITDTIEQGSRVALFGSFTYKSNATGKEITSPFGLLARFEGIRLRTSSFSRTAMALQARSKQWAPTRFHSDPSGKEVAV